MLQTAMDSSQDDFEDNLNKNAVSTAINVDNKKKKPFIFSRYPRRRIAILFLYLGWNYDGLVTQESTSNTIEQRILEAMEKTKMIESREIARWTRCGRTDKGVSGFRQIGAVTVRSTDVNAPGIFWPDESNIESRIRTSNELQFDYILNQMLPDDIRVLAWCPIRPDFNARFECISRSYVYVFPKGSLDIDLMQEGARLLVGQHDFRNFCFIDMNISRLKTTYERELYELEISPISESDGPYQMFQLKVRGSGFLWHQIRCIVAVLYDIGMKLEEPSVVTSMLNVKECTGRPQYEIASDLPLCFFDASYVDGLFDWKSCMNSTLLQKVFQQLQQKLCMLQTQAAIVSNMLREIGSFNMDLDINSGVDLFLKNGRVSKTHIPLLKRKRCDSLESKRKKMSKKLKIANVQ